MRLKTYIEGLAESGIVLSPNFARDVAELLGLSLPDDLIPKLTQEEAAKQRIIPFEFKNGIATVIRRDHFLAWVVREMLHEDILKIKCPYLGIGKRADFYSAIAIEYLQRWLGNSLTRQNVTDASDCVSC